MSIRLHTLGELKVFREGEEVKNLRTWKSRLGLLIYLTYHGESTRDHLTGVFWPEKPEQKARSSLSTSVSDLRKACGKNCILTQGEMYWVSEDVELDALLFQQAVEQGEFEKALHQYQGPFLSGISLVQTSAFQQWVGSVHSRLTGLHRKARSSEIEALTEAGQLANALVHARRWVELEPEDDGPVQLTMKLLARDGRRAEALQQFENFRRAMKMQDEEPLEETTELADRIRSGEEVGPVQILDVGSPRGSRPNVKDAGKPASPTEEFRAGTGAALGNGGAPLPARPWIVELAETIKDWWVFRGVLAFFTFSFVAIGVADGLGVRPITVKQLLAVAVGSMVLITPSLWAMEPWLRRQLGFDPPRTWRERPKDPTRGLWHRRGWLISAAVVMGVVVGVALWPATAVEGGDPPPSSERTGLAFLPILPADTTDEELSYLAEEVSQATIEHFRNFNALHVPNWRRVAGYRSSTLSSDSIFLELGVDYFLSGEISAEGDSIHLRWDLEDGESPGEQIEVVVPGGTQTARLEVLSEIVEQLTLSLRSELGKVIEARELRLGTNNPDAWAAMETGRRLANEGLQLMRSDLEQAARVAYQADSFLATAAQLDPLWAEPLIARAEKASLRASIGLFADGASIPHAPDAEGRAVLGRQALSHIEEALSRDPGNRDAYYQRASLLLDWAFYFGDLTPEVEARNLREAEEDLLLAASGPTPHAESMGKLTILLARDRGDYRQAKRLGRSALEQDPWLGTRRDVIRWLGMAHFELEEDQAALDRCAEPFKGRVTDWGERWMYAECQLTAMALGDLPSPSPDSAWTLLERTVLRTENVPRNRGPYSEVDYRSKGLLLYAGVLAAAGQPDSASAVYSRIETIEASQLSAGLLGRLGKPQEAFAKLQEFLQNSTPPNPQLTLDSRILRYLRGFPPFDSLRAQGG